jgi:hypothetical protein
MPHFRLLACRVVSMAAQKQERGKAAWVLSSLDEHPRNERRQNDQLTQVSPFYPPWASCKLCCIILSESQYGEIAVFWA